jgi:hypothetical protein
VSESKQDIWGSPSTPPGDDVDISMRGTGEPGAPPDALPAESPGAEPVDTDPEPIDQAVQVERKVEPGD